MSFSKMKITVLIKEILFCSLFISLTPAINNIQCFALPNNEQIESRTKDFIIQRSLNLIKLIGSYKPKEAEHQFQEAKEFFSSDSQFENVVMKKELNHIKQFNKSQEVKPKTEKIELHDAEKTDGTSYVTVHIPVEIKVWIGNELIEQVEKIYVIAFNKKLLIVSEEKSIKINYVDLIESKDREVYTCLHKFNNNNRNEIAITVLKTNTPKGARIEEDNLSYVLLNKDKIPLAAVGYCSDSQYMIGKYIIKDMPANTPLNLEYIVEDYNVYQQFNK